MEGARQTLCNELVSENLLQRKSLNEKSPPKHRPSALVLRALQARLAAAGTGYVSPTAAWSPRGSRCRRSGASLQIPRAVAKSSRSVRPPPHRGAPWHFLFSRKWQMASRAKWKESECFLAC